MNLVPLVELTRGNTTECLHFGAVAVVDTEGKLLAQAGDPHWTSFTRSTIKPLQALPLLESGAADALAFDIRQVAMLCASHNGEDSHVAQVQAMLERCSLDRARLRCGCHIPLRFSYGGEPVPAGLQVDERHNNCSGKHVGFLAACVHHGWPLDSYLEPDHPLQVAVRAAVARAMDMDEQDLVTGTDGCSAPNFAVPLSRLALAYARLASGRRSPVFGASLARLAGAMVAHPELVSGTGRNDLAFMRAGRGDWISKVGADGVQVVASARRGQALAIKVIDGSKPALFAAAVEAMEQLGWLDDAQRQELAPWRGDPILSARGLPVGRRLTRFRLQPAAAD